MEHSFAPKFQQTNKIFGNNKNASATTKINTKFISNIQFSLTRSYAYIHTEFRVFGNSLHTQNTIIRTEQNRIKHNQISFSHVLKSENRKIVYREKLLSVQFSILETSFFSFIQCCFFSFFVVYFLCGCFACSVSFVRSSVRPCSFVRTNAEQNRYYFFGWHSIQNLCTFCMVWWGCCCCVLKNLFSTIFVTFLPLYFVRIAFNWTNKTMENADVCECALGVIWKWLFALPKGRLCRRNRQWLCSVSIRFIVCPTTSIRTLYFNTIFQRVCSVWTCIKMQ